MGYRREKPRTTLSPPKKVYDVSAIKLLRQSQSGTGRVTHFLLIPGAPALLVCGIVLSSHTESFLCRVEGMGNPNDHHYNMTRFRSDLSDWIMVLAEGQLYRIWDICNEISRLRQVPRIQPYMSGLGT